MRCKVRLGGTWPGWMEDGTIVACWGIALLSDCQKGMRSNGLLSAYPWIGVIDSKYLEGRVIMGQW